MNDVGGLMSAILVGALSSKVSTDPSRSRIPAVRGDHHEYIDSDRRVRSRRVVRVQVSAPRSSTSSWNDVAALLRSRVEPGRCRDPPWARNPRRDPDLPLYPRDIRGFGRKQGRSRL